MGCVFPGSPDPETYWENICAKRSFIADHPDPESARYLDPNSRDFERVYSLRGGYLAPLATFDPIQHGVMPADVQSGDSDQFLTLRAASAAVEDAGIDLERIRRDRVEVILGHSTYFTPGNVNWFQIGVALEQTLDVIRGLYPGLSAEEAARIRAALKGSLPPMTAQTPTTLIPNIVASRLANRMDLMGPNYVIDAACATSHISVGNAVKDLLTDDCDYVLVGATQASCLVLELMLFCAIQGMSRQSALRPFDKQADGTMLGEGVGMLVLRRTKDAERDGNRIYAVIRGVGTASDGRAKGLLAPRLEGQELAIRRAYEADGVDPQTVEYVEAHGTGIPLGDVTEISALTEGLRSAAGLARHLRRGDHQVHDRALPLGRGHRRDHEGGAGAAPQGAAADPQLRRAEPGPAPGAHPVLHQHRDAPLDPAARRNAAAGRGERDGVRRHRCPLHPRRARHLKP